MKREIECDNTVELKQEQLMLGDWVSDGVGHNRIINIGNKIDQYAPIHPVCLNRNILMDNLFVPVDDRFFRLNLCRNYDEWTVEVIPAPYGGYFFVDAEHNCDEQHQGGIDNMKIFYVHQLQHILRLIDYPEEIKI